MTRSVSIRCLCACLLMAGAARAQGAAPGAPSPQPPPLVQTPPVSDPMLAPPPRAPREIASWDTAIAILREKSPQYLAGQQRVLQAQARSRTALGLALPVLDGNAAFTHQFVQRGVMMGDQQVQVPPTDVFGVGAQLRVPVVDLRAFRGVGTAERNERAAQLTFDEERRQLAMNVVQSMLATLAAARVAQLNREGLRAALERLALAKARFEYGQGTALDVDRAAHDVADSRADLIAGDEILKRSREDLGVLLGEPQALGAAENLDLEAFERAVAKTCRLHSDIEQRSDVAAARTRLEVQERLVDDAELRFLPTLDLVSNFNYATRVVQGPNTQWNVQGVLNVPLYDGTRYGAVDEARTLAEQARQSLIATRLAALVSVTRATRAVKVAEEGRAVAAERRELAQRIDQRIRQGFAGGIGTSLDMVISAESLRRAENRLALLEFEVAQARAFATLANAECGF